MRLRSRFPAIEVAERSLYRRTEGSSPRPEAPPASTCYRDRGQDLALRPRNSVARRLVMPRTARGQPSSWSAGTAEGAIRHCSIARQATVQHCGAVDGRAHGAGMPHEHRTFFRRFAERQRAAPGDWLADERVEAAKQLVCDGPMQMEEIAAAWGLAAPIRSASFPPEGRDKSVRVSGAIMNERQNLASG